jgi:glucan phosphoethanolaminetransferase (alkaline phosphatase superfamily)
MIADAPHIRTVAKVAALVLLFALAPWGWIDIISRRITQLYFDGRYNQLGRFVVLTAAMFVGIAMTAFLRDSRMRIGLTVVFALGFATDQIVQAVTGQHTSIELMQVLWSQIAMAGDAADTYSGIAMTSLAWILPIFAVLAMKPSDATALPRRYALLPLVCLIFAPVNIKITSQKIDEYPSTYGVFAQFAYVIFGQQVYAGPRQEIAYTGKPKAVFEKIVFVIDESIRADYLQAINPQFSNTPFLSSVPDQYSNFGVAISATNASVGSRVALRTGLRFDQLPDIKQVCLHQPAIWQFAKLAGMRTVYIDAWRPTGEMHSYMNLHEMSFIDQHISVREGPKHLIDAAVAERIKEQLAIPGPALIFVEKLGSHFPYALTVPPDSTYEPSGIDQLPAASNAAHRAVLRDYMRSTRNSVDTFLESLFLALTAPGTLAIYTSDHGQAMFEGGYEATHGSIANVHPGESRVPLLVFSGNAEFSKAMQASAAANHDKASHFEIFPTLLTAMGFDQEWVRRTYGGTLLDVPKDRHRKFLAGNIFGGTKSKLIDAE